MKMSRSERKAYNEGKREGYIEGYKQGLYDGNPFNRIVEAARQLVSTMTRPEVIQAIKSAAEENSIESIIEREEDEEE